jgi:hypothetical protein
VGSSPDQVDVCGSLYFNVKYLYSVYCFFVTILFMDFKPIKKNISDFSLKISLFLPGNN